MAVPLRTRSVPLGSVMTEYPVSPRVADLAVCGWAGSPGRRRRLRMLPDGCADLLWNGTNLVVAGAHTGPVDHRTDGETVLGLRLHPGVAGPLFGVPAVELPSVGVDVAAIWGARADRWSERLDRAATVAERLELLENLVAERADTGHRPDGLVVTAARQLAAAGRGVDEAGRAVGVSARELRRRFLDDLGHGPKTLQRILRFHGVLRLIGPLAARRLTLKETAASLGYADQAHLTRECRALAGVSPRQLIATWSAHAGTPRGTGERG